MTIQDLTIGEAMQVARMFSVPAKENPPASGNTHSFRIGTNYIIRTVTYHFVGRLVRVTDTDLVLEEAAWVADSGRWATALKTGVLNEVEPYPDGHEVIVSRGSLVDACEWSHPLPRVQK